jgi:hypothetical protein
MKYQQHGEGHKKKRISLERRTTSGRPEKEMDHCEIPMT